MYVSPPTHRRSFEKMGKKKKERTKRDGGDTKRQKPPPLAANRYNNIVR